MTPRGLSQPENGGEDEPVLMSEVARALGIHRATAYERARAGKLPVTWRGGRFEMRRSDLDRLVRERKGATAPAGRETRRNR